LNGQGDLSGGYPIHDSRTLRLRVASGRGAADIVNAETIRYDISA
jgi:hypothetical protein